MPKPKAETPPRRAVATVVERLGLAIVRGDFPPERPIPFEEALCQSYEVSRTSIREAVKVLTGKGLLAAARRHGTRVRPREHWSLLDADVLRWLLADPEQFGPLYADLVAARVAIEPAAARIAAEAATDAEIGELVAAAVRLADERLSMDEQITADVTFHRVLLSSTHNRVMIEFSKTITQMLRATMEMFRDTDEWNLDPARHMRIARAVEARDGPRAQAETAKLLEYNQALASRFAEAGHALAPGGPAKAAPRTEPPQAFGVAGMALRR